MSSKRTTAPRIVLGIIAAAAAATVAAAADPPPRLAGEAGVDEATAVTVDSAGNVLVAGFSESATTGYDYVTIKYSPEGTPLWARRYDGPGGEDDKATAIAADAAGDVYVTGSSGGAGGAGRDIATVKYAPDGRQLWVQRYNGPGSGYDAPAGLALDGAGNVYIAGTSRGTDTGFDYVTLKYSPEGKELWVKRYNGQGSGDDRVAAMAVDPAGSVYVTGSSHTSAKNVDYLTVKYSPEGKELWTRRYTGPHGGAARAVAVAIDGAGGAYVTGTSNDGHRDGFLTVKYASDGSDVWTRRYQGRTEQNDSAVGLGLDGAGSVYVVGASSRGTNIGYHSVIVKYRPDGAPVWIRRSDGPGEDRPVALGVSRAGEATVTGDTFGGSASGHDFLTVRWGSDGTSRWSDRYDGPGHDLDRPTALALDREGGAVVVGYSWGGGASRFDFTTIKYDREGHRQWVRAYDGARAADVATAAAADRSAP